MRKIGPHLRVRAMKPQGNGADALCSYVRPILNGYDLVNRDVEFDLAVELVGGTGKKSEVCLGENAVVHAPQAFEGAEEASNCELQMEKLLRHLSTYLPDLT